MACWKGYKKRGMKKKGDKIVPNCVPVNEELTEENVPTNPALWSRVKSQAKSKFDVYPSAYANGWAAKEYKAKGGGWKKKAKTKTQKESVTIEDMHGNPVVEIIDLITPSPMKGITAREETDLSGPQWNKMVSNRQLKDIKKERNTIHQEFKTSDRKEREAATKAERDNEKAMVKEDLRKWFGDGPKGGWDRYNTKGEKVGKCAREDKDGDGKGDGPKPKCLSNEKASKMSKKEIASSVKAKRTKDGDADRKGAPINVKNKGLDESMKAARTNVGASKCWDGYKAKGTKTKNGKQVPNCVKEGKSLSTFFAEAKSAKEKKKAAEDGHAVALYKDQWKDRKIADYDKEHGKDKRAKEMRADAGEDRKRMKELDPDWKHAKYATGEEKGKKNYKDKKKVDEAKDWIGGAIKKPGALRKELGVPEGENIPASKLEKAAKEKGKTGQRARLAMTLKGLKKEEADLSEVAAWQKKSGKNKEGGLNEKGRKSYEAENPGSDLKAPVTKSPSKLDPDSKSAKRRKSFCARMGGMKGPLKDEKGKPTRKKLALDKWNC